MKIMKPRVASVVWSFCCFFLLCIALPVFGDCGKERWDVKTLQDPSEREVSMEPDTSKTVADLRKVAPPDNLKTVGNDVRFPEEYVTYQVHALIIGFKKESDEDYHIVISYPESTEVTMIAEIPSPECANTDYRLDFDTERKFIEGLHKVSSKFYRLPNPLPVIVTGVFFFDFAHGQTGIAPNAAELHPLLKIETE